ncbi:MAG: hypothetical protein D6812_06625 [Deltaproteobacteria bacterium]|nr:MAG: hypothetical protein D6812_06625 [Deltaproteobacteria bacterium]
MDPYRGHVLCILPSSLRVEEILRRQLLRCGGNLLIDYRMMTFLELTNRLYADLKTGRKVIGRLGERVLLRSVVESLYESKGTAYFAPLIRYRGFFDFLQRFFGEVKGALVSNEDFRRVASGRSRKFRELAQIYDAYQSALEARGLDDGYDRDRKVLAHLETFPGPIPLLEGVERLEVEDLYDLNTVEFGIIRELARRIGEADISFPYDFERAEDIFKFVTRTVERFEQLYDLEADLRLHFREEGERAPELQALLDRVMRTTPTASWSFEMEHKIIPNGRIRIIEASSRYREVQEIAKEIRRLLQAGVNPGEIGVLFRSLAPYTPIIEDLFAAYDIPLFFRRGAPLYRNPLIKTILTLLDIPLQNAPRERVLKLIESNYIDLGLEALGLTEAEIVETIHAASILDNRDRGWERGFRRLQARLRRKLEELVGEADVEGERRAKLEEALTRVEKVAGVVGGLLDRLFALDQKMPPAGFVEALLAIVEDLRIRQRATEGIFPEYAKVVERDSFAIRCFEEILERILATFLDLSFSETRLSLAEFTTLLHDALQSESFLLERENLSSVYVLDLHQARGLSFRYVFLGGLIEGEFPASEMPDAIFRDNDRCLFNGAVGKKVFLLAKERSEEEPLLFYLGIRAAMERITFSYSTSNREGDEKMHRSYFLDEVVALLQLEDPAKEGGSVPVISRYPSTAVVPEFTEGFSAGEVLDRLSFNLRHNEAAFPLSTENLLTLELFNRILDHADLRRLLVRTQENGQIEIMREAFFETEEIGQRLRKGSRWTGRLSDPALLSHLFPEGDAEPFYWSGTRFETYQQCPFRFFLDDLLGLESPERPDIELEPNKHGLLVHELLEKFYTNARMKGLLPLGGRPQEREELHRVLKETIETWEREEFLGHRGLWNIRKEELREQLDRFLEAEIEAQEAGFLPTLFEVPFGKERDGTPLRFPLDRKRSIPIRGKIDRIDICREEGAILVIDYKNSKNAAAFQKRLKVEQMGEENFQIPIYLWAAATLVRQRGLLPRIERWQGSYYLTKSGRRITSPPLDPAFFEHDPPRRRELSASGRPTLADRISHILDRVMTGDFTITPRHCTFCKFATVCRYVEVDLKEEPP